MHGQTAGERGAAALLFTALSCRDFWGPVALPGFCPIAGNCLHLLVPGPLLVPAAVGTLRPKSVSLWRELGRVSDRSWQTALLLLPGFPETWVHLGAP